MFLFEWVLYWLGMVTGIMVLWISRVGLCSLLPYGKFGIQCLQLLLLFLLLCAVLSLDVLSHIRCGKILFLKTKSLLEVKLFPWMRLRLFNL